MLLVRMLGHLKEDGVISLLFDALPFKIVCLCFRGFEGGFPRRSLILRVQLKEKAKS